MKVNQTDDTNFNIQLNPRDIEALERELSSPPDWDVKDMASLIRFHLSCEVEYDIIRYDIC